MPSSPEPPARWGEKGGPRNNLESKKERERQRELSCWRNATGAVPELSLLSQMAAVARLGETCARGFLDLPFSVGGGESCLGAADVDFNEAARRQFRRRAMKATLAVHTGVAPGGACFWG